MAGPLTRLIALADKLDDQLRTISPGHDLENPLSQGKCVFLSLGDGRTRAVTNHCKALTVRDACKSLLARKQRLENHTNTLWRWARLDVAITIKEISWGELKQLFSKTKRNYFRYGIAFDEAMSTPITESELLGWSLLYSSEHPNSFPRESLLRQFTLNRFGRSFGWPEDDRTRMLLFSTISGFCDHSSAHLLEAEGPYRGYRKLDDWVKDSTLLDLIQRSTHYLSRQIDGDGKYCYGRWPCFDKRIATYNTLRHFSSTYSLLEGWEFTQQGQHLEQARRALEWGLTNYSASLDASKLHANLPTCFLKDINGEIKLGGTAHVVLALSKYQELTSDCRYRETISAFARGIEYMQDLADQGFIHVLDSDTFEIKDRFRIVYYDGEALFALVRAYEATGLSEFLQSALRAADDFIADEHWKAHDHWLAYGFAALFRYSPRREFLRFGLDNIRDYLGFIKARITTYPTLLELCTATQRLVDQAEGSAGYEDLINAFDLKAFTEAMDHRARYLVNGFFWPETAMFFRKPESILNSFFIRHHAFRTRIDDNEHYISGLCAFHKLRSRCKSAIWMLNRSIPSAPGGIEFAAMQRAGLMLHEPSASVAILTIDYDPGLQRRVKKLQDTQRINPRVCVLNLFDWIQGADESDPAFSEYHSISLSEELRHETRQSIVDGTNHERWVTHDGRSSLYWVKGEASHGYDYINYFHAGVKWRRETFAPAGWLSRTQLLCQETGTPIQETYHRRVDASIALTIIYQATDDASVIQQVLLHDNQGKVAAMHPDLSPLIAQWMNSLFRASDATRQILVCDRIKDYFNTCRRLRSDESSKDQTLLILGCLHSHHCRPNGSGRLSPELKNYVQWLSDPQAPFDALVCLTQRQANEISSSVSSIPCVVIPHAASVVDNAMIQGRQRKIVYIARYSLEKNHETALSIAFSVCRVVSDVDFHFYGGGHRRGKLQSLVEREGFQERITVGSHHDAPSMIYQESCLSMSTSHYEGLSLGILESLSNGCPVVAFDVEYGPRELIQNGVNGMLIEPDDSQSFAQALITLLRDEDLLTRLQRGACAQRDHFLTPAQVQARWRSLMNSLD